MCINFVVSPIRAYLGHKIVLAKNSDLSMYKVSLNTLKKFHDPCS